MAKTSKATKTKATKKAPAAKATPAKKTAKAAVKTKAVAKPAKAPVKAAAKTPAKPVKAAAPVKAAPVAKAAKPVKAPVLKATAKPQAKPARSILPSVPVKAKPQTIEVAPAQPKKNEKLDFTTGDFVVYPAHGVGYVEGVETQMIAGMEITLYTISFEKDRMRLKLPVSKVKASGLRKLSSKDRLKDALGTLQGRSQTRRIMWSRRAQEYEAKINSGDPVSIAEVLRDLRKDNDQSEQSYSERQIYQAALERLAREVAAIEKIDEKKAAEKLEAVLSNVA